ncbi:MAG: HDOD domain-containing protein [Deltaproteobacteria bacterium]|nr:HDOD domain-containing protein [Deltaproteobacteria bacterium]MBW2032886.1 HDOD domain-containing protein [Deltaproteobacteria bacterium]
MMIKGFESHDKAANSESGPQDTLKTSEPDHEDQAVLKEIFDSLEDIDLGFDFRDLDILDDEEAAPAKIEEVKDRLGDVVSARLFSLANSAHYGGVRSGNITKFIDVVMRMGSDTVRSTVLYLGLLGLAKTDRLKEIFARNFATSKLAEMIANQCGLADSEKAIVSLGGLFMEMGKVIILLYAEKGEKVLDEVFIEKYHPHVAGRLIERWELPHSVKEIVCHPYFTFVKRDSFALSAIVDMAHFVVDKSFCEHGKLIIQSPMPDPKGILYNFTTGSLLRDQFEFIGLDSYLKVVPSELSEQEKRFCETYK